MDSKSWIEKKQIVEEKYGVQCRHIIISLKKGLAHKRLGRIKRAVNHLHEHPSHAPIVVARFNRLMGSESLKLRWYPDKQDDSGQLLIRNRTVGLLVKSAPDALPRGIMLTPNRSNPVRSLNPETALTILSDQFHQIKSHPHVC